MPAYVPTENSECSQHARPLTFTGPFGPYTLLFTKEQLRLRNVKEPVVNTLLVNPELGSNSLLVRIPNLIPNRCSPLGFTASGSTLCLPGVNSSANSRCLPSSPSQMLRLLSKRCLETSFWVPVLLIVTEMSLLPGSVLSGDRTNQYICIYMYLCIYGHGYMNTYM